MWGNVSPYARLSAQAGYDGCHPLGRKPLVRGVEEQCRTLRIYARPGSHVRLLNSQRLLVEDESKPISAPFP